MRTFAGIIGYFGLMVITGLAQDVSYDVIWIDSDPSGAQVTVNGEEKGETPIFLGNLDDGRYEITVGKVGYVTEQLNKTIPADEAGQELVTLRQRAGTCLITSEPSHASVLHGSQLLGRTPLVLDSLPEGQYDLRLIKLGYAEGNVSARLSSGTASTATTTMNPNTGGIEISCIPAAAKVFIDNSDMGVTSPGDAGMNKSAPTTFGGLRAARHKVEIEYNGVRSAARAVVVQPGGVETLLLMLWYPDVKIKLRSGREVVGMVIQTAESGDLVVAKTLTDHVRVKATDILEKSKLSLIDARKMAKDALPKK